MFEAYLESSKEMGMSLGVNVVLVPLSVVCTLALSFGL